MMGLIDSTKKTVRMVLGKEGLEIVPDKANKVISIKKKKEQEKIETQIEETEEELLENLIDIKERMSHIISRVLGEIVAPEDINKKLGDYMNYFDDMIKIQMDNLEKLKESNPKIREKSFQDMHPEVHLLELKKIKTGIDLDELRNKYHINDHLIKTVIKEINEEIKLLKALKKLKKKRQNV